MLIVSNRLPFTVGLSGDNLRLEQSGGGLVSGLSAYLDSMKGDHSRDSRYVWVGWPGMTIPEEWKERLQEKALWEYSAHPVFLKEDEMENFYHGFCNKTIWPLFHYFPQYCIYEEEYWKNYKDVTQVFCDAVLEIARPDDVIWIHDYHLLLLPGLLRKKLPGHKIGFFLHIPFPSYEIFRAIPGQWRRELLEGMLGSDLIGFHTAEYTQYFQECVHEVLGLEKTSRTFILDDRISVAETFPMGIDFQKYNIAASSRETDAEKLNFKRALGDVRVVLSIDRLDYSKGILNRLLGYEIFLQKHTEWRRKVTVVLIVVPSRIGVEHYLLLKKQIDEAVGRINGDFSDLEWSPIHYQYRFLSFEPLIALYSISDVALITPLRDGMNLIAKEYLASRVDKTGVLILSEMAGAANELDQALVINPNDKNEIAESIRIALEMPKAEQVRRNVPMIETLQQQDVASWASKFLQVLLSAKSGPLVLSSVKSFSSD